MDHLLDAMYATADAVKEAVDDDETFTKVARTIGYPVDMRDEHFWVSVSLDSGDIKPADSGLQLFASHLKIGGGITVAQVLRSDWSPLRTRLLVLVDAFEELIRSDPTVSGTCSRAFISGLEARSTLDGEKKGRLTAFWELDVEQYVGG